MISFTSQSIAPGVKLHHAVTNKFKTVSIRACVLHPLLRETVTGYGLLSQVLKRGCQKYPTYLDIAKHLEYLFGAGFSASTGKIGETQILDFSLSVANDIFLPQAKGISKDAISFLGEIMFNPNLEGDKFLNRTVSTEKENLRRRLEGLIDERYQYAIQRCYEIMCSEEPFRFYSYGLIEDIDKITPESLYADYKKAFTQGEIHIFVVGAIEEEGIVQAIKGLPFKTRVQQRDTLFSKPEVILEVKEVKNVVEEIEITQGILVLGCRLGITYQDDRFAQVLVYNGILGGFAHSKLFTEVREKSSLAYSVYSRYESLKGIQIMYAGIDVDKSLQAKELMLLQLEEIAKGNIETVEMEMTKKSLINGLLSSQDSASGIISRGLLGAVAGYWRNIDDLINEIEEVTIEQVSQIASMVKLDTVYLLKGNQ